MGALWLATHYVRLHSLTTPIAQNQGVRYLPPPLELADKLHGALLGLEGDLESGPSLAGSRDCAVVSSCMFYRGYCVATRMAAVDLITASRLCRFHGFLVRSTGECGCSVFACSLCVHVVCVCV